MLHDAIRRVGSLGQVRVPARRGLWLGAIAAAAMLMGSVACAGDGVSPAGASGNVLYGQVPTKSEGVQRAEVLTDGVIARPGGSWLTELTAFFASSSSFVEYDLGRSFPFSAALLQGDNNDDYVIAVSEDGVEFARLWIAPPRNEGGLQARFTADLRGSGRYVRIAATRGDQHYSLSEVQLFAERPAVFPPHLPERTGIDIGEAVRGQVLLFALAMVAFLFVSARGFRCFYTWGALGCVLFTARKLGETVFLAWPLAPRDISLVRAAAAGIAALAVWGATFLAPRFRPDRRASVGMLGLCAAASLASFWNLGYPQFFDHSRGAPNAVHNQDMRVYFPVAKYFDELRFDGLYLASVAAYVDDNAGATLASLAKTELRDLRTHRMTHVGEVEDQIRAVQKRFSPERWRAFKQDMRYFRQTMGVGDYLGSLTDHGGNATPVWLTVAHLLFANATASNATLLAGALLDPFLLLVMFIVIGRTFGMRTMLLSMIVFGANDFYMFGSNWAGATLRHDWIAYLGLGVSALKRERWTLGGALLALSAMIRAFPALALVGAVMPIGWVLWAAFRAGGRPLLWDGIRQRGDLSRVVLGAAACVVMTGLISSFFFSFDAWADWLRKVSLLDHGAGVNEISLRALIAGSNNDQQAILRARWPLYAVGAALFAAAVIASCRGKRLDQAAVLGLLLLPVVFNPANYYLHLVCLLPLLANESRLPQPAGDAPPLVDRPDAANWIALLAMCVASYWTVLEQDAGIHFQYATVVFFAGATFILANTMQQTAALTPAAVALEREVPKKTA